MTSTPPTTINADTSSSSSVSFKSSHSFEVPSSPLICRRPSLGPIKGTNTGGSSMTSDPAPSNAPGLPLLRRQMSGSPISLSTDYRGEETTSNRSDERGRGDTTEDEESDPETRRFLWCWLHEDKYSPTRSDEGTWAEEYFRLKFQDLHISDEEDEGRRSDDELDELIRAIEATRTDPGPSSSQAVDVLRQKSSSTCGDTTTVGTTRGSAAASPPNSHVDHRYRGPHQHRDCVGTMGFCDDGRQREIDHSQRDDRQAFEPLAAYHADGGPRLAHVYYCQYCWAENDHYLVSCPTPHVNCEDFCQVAPWHRGESGPCM
jgi:hypothetical protein